ncbi:MAG: FG-GAP-like repeat-containing protein [Planctomycetota bacterium JB042]
MRHHPKTPSFAAACLVALLASSASAQTPLDTSFKFQGELRLSNVVVNTNHDFIFDVFGAAAGGASLGTNNRPNTPVARGVFTVTLDFGAGVFDGDKRWVEIRVRDTSVGGAFTTLSPRVELNAAPNALFAARIGDDSVDSSKIVDGSVTSNDIATGAVGSAKIANGAVSNAKLANNAVTSATIADGSVTSADIANGAIGSAKIATDAVGSAKIADGSVSAADIGPDIVSSLAGVSNDGGNIGLLAGTNMTITPNDAANTITFAASSNASTLDGLDSPQFLRSDVADTFTGGVLGFSGGTLLNMSGGSSTDLTIGGANLQLFLGDSVADTTTVVGDFVTDFITPSATGLTVESDELFLGTTATTTIRFLEGNTNTFLHRIAWEDGPVDAGSLTTCATTGAIDSAMIFELGDITASGWAFTNGTDPEVTFDEIGTIAADGSVTALAGCDLAETFFGPEGLDAGTLLRADPNAPEAVLPTAAPYDAAMIGIVSTVPAFRMSGASTESLPLMLDLLETQRQLHANPGDAALQRRFAELELAVDSWPRGNVDVALVGRVPVKVVGPVRAGEPLTSSAVAGHAMALDRPGPSIGIALDRHSGGRGTVLALVQPGWRQPLATGEERETLSADDTGHEASSAAGAKSLSDRVAALEDELGLRTVAGRAGADGRDGTLGRDGGDGRADPRGVVPIDDGRAWAGPHDEVWGDVDGDGLDDVLVLDPRNGARLLRNRGDGSFGDVTATAGLGDTVGTRLARFADYDVDRRLDLLLVDAAGVAHLFQGAGTGAFLEVTERLGLDFGQPIVEASFLDYDHDGLDDLRVELADGTLVLHHNRGQGTFQATVLRQPVAEAEVERANARITELEAQVTELKGMVEALLVERAESNR